MPGSTLHCYQHRFYAFELELLVRVTILPCLAFPLIYHPSSPSFSAVTFVYYTPVNTRRAEKELPPGLPVVSSQMSNTPNLCRHLVALRIIRRLFLIPARFYGVYVSALGLLSPRTPHAPVLCYSRCAFLQDVPARVTSLEEYVGARSLSLPPDDGLDRLS